MSDGAIDPSPVEDIDVAEAECWAASVLTSAHHELEEYIPLSQDPPPGGVSSLVSLTLALMEELGAKMGMTREQVLQTFFLAKE